MGQDQKIRILIADPDITLARKLADVLRDSGFATEVCSTGKEARARILDWKPRLVLADLLLREGHALSLLEFIKTEPALRHQMTSLIVTSAHNTEANVRQAFQKGAKDYLVKPFNTTEVIKRIIFHCRSHRKLKEIHQRDYGKIDESSLMLHLTDLVLRQAMATHDPFEALFNLTRMVSLKVDGVRCSIVHCLNQSEGVVVTSNDDKGATGIQIQLSKYPEILHVFNTNLLVAIENIEQNAELKQIKYHLKDVSFNSIIVCPVSRSRQPFGVISLRMPKEKETLSDNEIRFVEIVSHVVSLVLSSEAALKRGDFWLRESRPPLAFPFKLVK